MPWLNKNNIQTRVKNIGIPHESAHSFFDIIGDTSPNQSDGKINAFSIPRPIFENINETLKSAEIRPEILKFITYQNPDPMVPIFGSFGFGFGNKGFDKIIAYVNSQYDNAVIKFVIPVAHFDPDPNTVTNMINKCIHVQRKPGIVLLLSHEFFSTEEILLFLKSNTMNLFLYDQMKGRLYKTRISECMQNSMELVDKYSKEYSHKNTINAFLKQFV